jgi:AcrR family transcriptional regulator
MEATRQAIVKAARQLFSERGYFATKVDDVAALARVAPATVYAVSGGKQGLLRTLTETSTTDPTIEATIGSIEKLDDPSAILRLVAATVRSMREQFGDIMRVLLNAAPHDKAVARAWPLLRPATATRSCQSPSVLWIWASCMRNST